ncbi:MAG: hypothetical protein A2X31_01675 [Elusimicrobia bacterium GWB2_63_22]|nr:MAG: hypothetical protein A2X31_01675 [Elusimicrobia bacterium GWB2_63_22]
MLLKTALALVLAVPAAGAAQETAVATAPVQASTAAVQLSTAPVPAPLPEWRLSPLRRLSVDLDRLARFGWSLPPERLDALAAEAAALSARVREALGRDVLAAVEREEAPRLSEAAKKTLARFRAELQVYYATNGGKYPASPARLAPDQIHSVPALELPGHEASAVITLIDSRKFDNDASKAVTDSGGWLYFTAPESANYGLLLIDCSHREPGGEEFYKY